MATAEERLAQIEQRMEKLISLQKLILLAAGGSLPTTLIGNNFIGDNIGTTNRYVELYRNNFNRLISLKVTADFVIPGATASLSLTTDLANNGRIALLSSTGPVISNTIWLKPDQVLYINTADTTFSLNGSIFRVLIFDPLSFEGFLGGGI